MILAVVLIALVAGSPAAAHGTLAGGGGFYAGFAHPFVALEQFLLLLGLGLCLGRAHQPAAQPALAGLALGLIAGLGAQASGLSVPSVAIAVLGLGTTIGLVVASAWCPSGPVVIGLATLIGAVLGLDTGVPVARTGQGVGLVLLPFVGVTVGVMLLVLNAMALAGLARKPAWTIGLRMAGSWIAAASLMVLALSLRRLRDGA